VVNDEILFNIKVKAIYQNKCTGSKIQNSQTIIFLILYDNVVKIEPKFHILKFYAVAVYSGISLLL
jgi:hypothetical protein